MDHEEAVAWLAANGKYPLSCHDGKASRWYPDTPSNRQFLRKERHHCLIPEKLYWALSFAAPKGWSVEHYPWFDPYTAGIEAAIVALMSVGSVESMANGDAVKYTVQIDGFSQEIEAKSLAGVANAVRGRGEHIIIWSPSGVILVDTQFGDGYSLVKRPECSG